MLTWVKTFVLFICNPVHLHCVYKVCIKPQDYVLLAVQWRQIKSNGGTQQLWLLRVHCCDLYVKPGGFHRKDPCRGCRILPTFKDDCFLRSHSIAEDWLNLVTWVCGAIKLHKSFLWQWVV